MNVQFSLFASTSPSVQYKSEFIPTNEALSTGYQTSDSSLRDTKDLNSKGKPNVNVSVAEGQLIRTIERAVKSLQGPQTTLEISIHEKTHDIMVKVLNKETGELIREVPPEKTLDLVAKMMEIAGILIDEKI